MFTGLIEEIGKIAGISKITGKSTLQVLCEKISQEAKAGDSISVNGICLTVKTIINKTLGFDISPESVSRTTFRLWEKGRDVNIEQALRPSDHIGGHFVQGHIDCTSRVTDIKKNDSFHLITLDLPDCLSNYIVEKGSIAVDGVSLTVLSQKEKTFEVSIIPATFQSTIIHTYKRGTEVNIEADILAKYIERIIGAAKNQKDKNILNYEKLKTLGYQ